MFNCAVIRNFISPCDGSLLICSVSVSLRSVRKFFEAKNDKNVTRNEQYCYLLSYRVFKTVLRTFLF